MSQETVRLDTLVKSALACLAEPGNDNPPSAETSFRDRFSEILVLAMGNLFPKMPNSSTIYDRTTLQRVVMGLDDNDAATLGRRADDWMRLEGLIKQEEGKRSYYLPLGSMAVLSVPTESGLLGDVFGAILRRYQEANPSDGLRAATRALGAAFLTMLKA